MATLTSSSIGKAGSQYIATKRLYINESRTKIVDETDPTVGFLLAPVGGAVSYADAVKFGLITEAKEAEPGPEKIEQRTTRVPKNLATR